jgi:GTP-binding protein LepA
MTRFDNIRNFSIIAHIDHGKSTLADRILQITNTVAERDMREQMLDRMDLERERGITIKAQAVRIYYDAEDGREYEFNLIDTPGHVDFTYEVSRSLAACEGALLVVDATQGVEAQTLANALLALENDLEIIPVLNKIDLPGAEPEKRADEIVSLIGCARSDILYISAKTGEGVPEVLEAVVKRIPPPEGDEQGAPRALIFDSMYDQYRGVVAFVRVKDGSFRKGDPILALATGRKSEIEEVGIFSPDMLKGDVLSAGEVGYITPGIKEVADLRVGDTLTSARHPALEPLPGYREVTPMVF